MLEVYFVLDDYLLVPLNETVYYTYSNPVLLRKKGPLLEKGGGGFKERPTFIIFEMVYFLSRKRYGICKLHKTINNYLGIFNFK